jgi:hypothetical protein
MADIIKIDKYKPINKQDTKESDLAMFSVLWFTEHFGELLSGLDEEIRYALVISTYRFMVDAEKTGEAEITSEGFSITTEASIDLQDRIKGAVDWKKTHLN